jgi:hypothetical protein
LVGGFHQDRYRGREIRHLVRLHWGNQQVEWVISELDDILDFRQLAQFTLWFQIGVGKPRIRFRHGCFRAVHRELVAWLDTDE